MKGLIIVLGVLAASAAEPQVTNFYTNVTNLWYQGHKSNVLEIAEQRLNINSNDMPGLLIKLAYEEAFLHLGTISNSLNNVIVAGGAITNANFKACYPRLKFNNEYMLEFATRYHPTPTQLMNERAKGFLPNKPFPYGKELEALQKDELCEPLDP